MTDIDPGAVDPSSAALDSGLGALDSGPTAAPLERSGGAHRVGGSSQGGAGQGGAGQGGGPSRSGGSSRAGGGNEGSPSGLAVLGAAVKEIAIVVGLALVLSFIVKTWLLQAFYIPSGSMEDTLRVDDRVIVSKLTPGPIALRRGDIVVFADPGDWVPAPVAKPQSTVSRLVSDALTFVGLLPDTAENHLIKRVIGLPGDHVVCCDVGGRITINGVPVKEPYLKAGNSASEQNFDITVPAGRIWVMGDHRSDSSDSRFHDGPKQNGSTGSVPESLIVGRAVALVWPLDHLAWLSNPSDTFAKVPAPAHALGQSPPTTNPTGTGGSPQLGGGTGSAPVSLGAAARTRSGRD
ncbi:MAG TPA: signal peptidase I [Pedococcus sp.]|nr:signal peptidase I [Pedococcus sp.]